MTTRTLVGTGWSGDGWDLGVSLAFEPRDAWVGVYWDNRTTNRIRDLHVFICLLPFFPIHIHLYRIGGKHGRVG